jgi:hypothetical protein
MPYHSHPGSTGAPNRGALATQEAQPRAHDHRHSLRPDLQLLHPIGYALAELLAADLDPLEITFLRSTLVLIFAWLPPKAATPAV